MPNGRCFSVESLLESDTDDENIDELETPPDFLRRATAHHQISIDDRSIIGIGKKTDTAHTLS